MPQDYPQAAVPSSACRAAAESGGRLLDRRSVGMSDFWHKMGCCVVAKPPPKKKRRKIDRSMIGEPTNFIHLTHIGSGEMAEGLQPVGVSAGTDEVERPEHERQEQPVIAGVTS